MKNMRFISFLILFFFYSDFFCQTPEQNHAKYWYYRHRLLNNFMVVGDCQGCSLPAARRESDYTGVLSWGDGQDLGWYIGILATEYKLLKDHNQNPSQTIEELYYALEAFNRLDYKAEIYWGGNGNYNGFFVRDDVPSTFIQDYPDNFNSPLVQTQLPPVIDISSSKDDRFTDGRPRENSQDNVIHLMLGLSLVNAFVDEYAVYNDGSGVKAFSRDGETSILKEAWNISYDVVNWIKIHSWIVKNAVTGENVLLGACCPFLISYGFAEAYCKATDHTNAVSYALTGFDCLTFADYISSPNIPIWWNYQLPGELEIIQAFSAHLIGLLAAIGNSWHETPSTLTPNTTALSLSSHFGANAPERLNVEYLPLLRQVLHGGINLVPNDVYTDLLNSAPCQGPYNFGGGNFPNYEWSSPHRFRDPEYRGDENPWFPGEYYGIDYMLLFNLYSLAKEDYLSSYYNMLDINVTTDYPHLSPPFLGSQLTPIEIDAFNTITASNHINSGTYPFTTGDVVYRAGQEIAMLPGFGVEEGAEFGAIVEPFHCVNGDYVRMAEDSGKPREIYTAPTSYVYYANASETPRPKNFSENIFSHAVPDVKSLIQTEPSISIIPNPSSGTFTLMSEGALQSIEIRDVLENIMLNKTVNNQPINIDIDISSHPRGIYFLKIQTKDKIYTEKIVVQ